LRAFLRLCVFCIRWRSQPPTDRGYGSVLRKLKHMFQVGWHVLVVRFDRKRRDSVKAGRRQRTPLVVLWRIQVHGNQRHCRICFSSDSLVSDLSSEMEEKNDAVTMRNISILKVKSRVRQRVCHIFDVLQRIFFRYTFVSFGKFQKYIFFNLIK